jgi:hypothetical protein
MSETLVRTLYLEILGFNARFSVGKGGRITVRVVDKVCQYLCGSLCWEELGKYLVEGG